MVSSWGVRDASQAAHHPAFISSAQDRYASIRFNSSKKNLHQTLTNPFLRSFVQGSKRAAELLEPWFYSTLPDFCSLLSVFKIRYLWVFAVMLTGTKNCTSTWLYLKFVPVPYLSNMHLTCWHSCLYEFI